MRAGAQEQAVISGCRVEVEAQRMEVAGRSGDKSPLIKAMSTEQSLVQNLNQPIIQPAETGRGVLCVFVCS